MATKKTGIMDKVKGAVSDMTGAVTGMFKDDPKRKSPKRVAAGKKAAVTRGAKKAVKSARATVAKVAKKATARKSAGKAPARKAAKRA